MSVGSRLEDLRVFMKMTQEEFGQELGVSGSTISGFELEKHPINDQVRTRLINKYGVRQDWLLKGEGKTFDDRTHLDDFMGVYVRLGEEKRKIIFDSLCER